MMRAHRESGGAHAARAERSGPLNGPVSEQARARAPASAPAFGVSGDPIRFYQLWRPTHDWVRVHVRRLREVDVELEVRRFGDRGRGTVLLCVDFGDGLCRLLHQVATGVESFEWISIHGSCLIGPDEARMRMDRYVEGDPDAWIIAVDAAALDRVGAVP